MSASTFWAFVVAVVIAILSAQYSVYNISFLSAIGPSLYAQILCPTVTTYPGYLGYGGAEKPHHSSWDAWWHPQRSHGRGDKSKDSAGVMTKGWNILYHLGGNGPWVEKVIDVVEGGIATPEGCEVVQVHMVRICSLLLLEYWSLVALILQLLTSL